MTKRTLFVLTLAILTHTAFIQAKEEARPFAVVELFTSQGCSSCPPADQLLRELTERARDNNEPIYTLSFHVDYWNRLGWKDPYSQSDFTRRQHQYADAFGNNTVYTPQMVVNGRHEFTGSSSSKASKSIAQELKRRPASTVDISSRVTDGRLQVRYTLNNAPQSARLHVALVETGLSNFVPRGENAKRTLTHDHVVRSLKTLSSHDSAGEVSFKISKDMKLSNVSIIAFLQDEKTMEILGATMKDLQ